MHISRREFTLASLATLAAGPGAAQSRPTSARLIVGFPPGSGPDMVARRLGIELTGKLADSVVVDNRTGASGNIAVNAALEAEPDGATLISNPSGVVTVQPHTYRKLPFDPFNDLTPVSLVCRYELGLAVGPAVPASVKTLADFADWVRNQKGPQAYGSPGAGSPIHFMAYAYARSQGLDMGHVPYRGASPMAIDLLGGRLAAGAGSLPALMAQAGDGRLRVLASTGVGRSRAFPSIPTFEEQGVTGLSMREWHGIYIGRKPDPSVVQRANALVRSAVDSPAFVEALIKQGFEAVSSTPQELDQLARNDSRLWGEIVKASGFVQDS